MPWLRRGAAAPPDQVASALARAAVPGVASDPAPSFLRPEQRVAFGTLLTILRRHRCALLADATGTGKTFVALAVAGALAPDRTAAIVPATLREQWTRRGAELGVPVRIITHEEVSRGHLPAEATRFVVVDESHRFRNPSTRRYRTLARWLDGRRLLLVTASPLVNEMRELANQLRLGARDDALQAAGVRSLAALGRTGRGHPALAELIVSRGGSDAGVPRSARSFVEWGEALRAPAAWAEQVEELRLSRQRPTAELIRATFWSAAASSPAALLRVTRRYARLLDQARDAERVGQRVSRAELRRFTGPTGGQLVLWELLQAADDEVDLDPGDRDAVGRLGGAIERSLADGDSKLDALRRILADGRRSLVFTTFVETVRYLRNALPGAAWCTGEAAGVGHLRAPRAAILGAFGPGSGKTGPRVLVTSDIAAEGLDLQGTERVVHYDLPWTPMRLRQREGRIVRLGSSFAQVEIVSLRGPQWLEDRALRAARIRAKSRMDVSAGFGDQGQWRWRWRHDLAASASGDGVSGGSAVVAGERSELLVGIELREPQGRIAAHLGLVRPDGSWCDEPRVVAEAIAGARNAASASADDLEWERWSGLALPHARRILQDALGRRWAAAGLTPPARLLLSRLRMEARAAARARDRRSLDTLERGMRFATRGHTAGEEMAIEELARAGRAALMTELSKMREDAEDGVPTLRITGMILVRRDGGGARC